MLPLIPTLALAFVSFISSAFVILRILIPILPPNPLSRRVPPSEFGLPNVRSISTADKSHIWLASCDILALALFAWEAVNEHLGGSTNYAIAQDPAAAVRLWIALTLRQTCLLVIASLTLLHVRMGRPVTFGGKHWMLWAPTLLLAVTSTSLAGVLAGTGFQSLFIGLVAYSTSIAVISSVAFACLIGTLVIIRRNLNALDDIRNPWPPAKEMIEEEKPRPSFATEDIDALKDGSSWITSRASSRNDSISAFSFSTHHSAKMSSSSMHLPHPATASYPSIPPKSSYWFNPATPYSGRDSPVPPVPPLPAPYRPVSSTGENLNDDPDPFRRQAVPRMGSQSSWLTEPSVYQPTLSNWSFPTTGPDSSPPHPALPELHTDNYASTAVSRPITPAMASAEVLGGYGYSPDAASTEKGVANAAPTKDLDVSIYRTIGWLVTIWIPLALAMPYLFTVSPGSTMSNIVSILLVLSVTLSSPLLALNILFRSPLPIPSGLFETYSDPPSAVLRGPSPASSVPTFKFSHEYKRSGSVTVVEGRRSGDVWLSNGDAIDGKSKFGRAAELLLPKPKLSVLPPEDKDDVPEAERTPPLPMQNEHSPTFPTTPQSENSAELGRNRSRKESKASSHYSGGSDSVAFATQIMIAQRHYSTLAMTMVLPPSPDRRASVDAVIGVVATGLQTAQAEERRASQHLRTRSVSSVSSVQRFPLTPPPSSPLPPTPPSVRELKQRSKARMVTHRKSQSHSSVSEGFSFGPVGNDDAAEIDALSARLLPLLVPGLKVGSDVKVRDDWKFDEVKPRGFDKGTFKSTRSAPMELGGISSEFSSPEIHSTPAAREARREKKISTRGRKHFSLPSLGLGKDGIHALSNWRNDLNRALESKVGYTAATTSDVSRRATVWGGEAMVDEMTHLKAVREEDETSRPTSPSTYTAYPDVDHMQRVASTHTFGPAPQALDVPTGVNSARNSLTTLITALDQELHMGIPRPPLSSASDVTLFDPSADGPVAESTPHESQRTHSRPPSTNVPPVPRIPSGSSNAEKRRSSIMYIKSDENAPPTTSTPNPNPTRSSSRRLAQYASRAVRPLVPKSKDKENATASPGLRQLSLLQDRDVNRETRPLAVGKGKKPATDENADPNARNTNSGGGKGLKPLKLSRSETTKQRAVLRRHEVLPDVVVRPPSQTHNTPFGFTFQ